MASEKSRMGCRSSNTRSRASAFRCRSFSRGRRRCPSFSRSEEHTSELQSQSNLVCRLLLEKKKAALQERADFRGEDDRLEAARGSAIAHELLGQPGSLVVLGLSRDHDAHRVILALARDRDS